MTRREKSLDPLMITLIQGRLDSMGNSARRLATLRDAALSQAFRLVRGAMDILVKIGTLLFLPWVLAALPSIWGGLRAESVVVKIVSGVLILGAGIVCELTVAAIVTDNNQRSVGAQTAALNERTARERERLFAVRATGGRAEFAGSISRTQVRASAHRDQPDRSIVITRIGRS